MDNIWILAAVGIAVLFFILWWLIASVRRDRDKIGLQRSIVKGQAMIERERIQSGALLKAERVRSDRQRSAILFGVVGVFLLGGVVSLTILGSNLISEWGESRRTRQREETRRAVSADRSWTITELDHNRTIRSGYRYEAMTEKAWSEAYATSGRKRGGSFPWWILVLAGLLAALVWSLRSLRELKTTVDPG